MATAGGRALRRPSMWKVPYFVFGICMAVTAIFAVQQDRAESDRAKSSFEAERTALETRLSAAISQRINEFEVGVDFLGSAPRIDPKQLSQFLDQRSGIRSSPIDGDLGFSVTEFTSDVDALEARERSLGREFEVFAPLPSRESERLIITHLERDIPVMGRSFIGFDVTSFQDTLVPRQTPDATGRVIVQVTAISELFGGLRTLGAAVPDEGEYEEAVMYLIARYRTKGALTSGYATRVESVSAIIEAVEQHVPAGYHLSAALTSSDRPIAEVERRSNDGAYLRESLNVVGNSRNRVIDLAPLEIVLTASDEIVQHSRGIANLRLWIIGLSSAVLAALFAAMRAHQARRLADTGIELELAQTMASTDPLTGLLNRQGLVDAIEQPMSRTGVLLFIDVDNFKQVNDEDGHAEGDRVLRHISTELRQMVRSDDVLCRLGGDEFLVFLPSPIDDDRVAELTSLITASVRSIDTRISCSIGSAKRTIDHMLSMEVLLRKADAAMYEHKRSKPMSRR